MAPYINWTKLTFIKYLIQQQHHKHSSQVHMGHSPMHTTFWPIKPTLTDLKNIYHTTEKAMVPHSSTLAWKIPWTKEPGGLQSMGSLSRTRLSDFTFTFHFHALEKAMAPHSSVLAWRIPGMGKPGGLQSMGSQSQTRLKRLSSSSSISYKVCSRTIMELKVNDRMKIPKYLEIKQHTPK